MSTNEPITIFAHSHGGNVAIEAINTMVNMEEFKDRKINLVTINTPVRKDYQLSNDAKSKVNHINIYDEKDPVQINGGNSTTILKNYPSSLKETGEYGKAKRIFKGAQNISVDNPKGIFFDFHNSHNLPQDWIHKIK